MDLTFTQPHLNKLHRRVLDEMLISAKKRCLIPNANNGRAYMGCILLDGLRPLCSWLQQV